MRLPDNSQRGFTILETLVAATISGALLLAAVPNVSSALSAGRLQSASRATAQYLRLVRATAVGKNLQSRLVVSGGGSTLSTEVYRSGAWTATGQPLVLEGGASVASVLPSASALVFTSQGTTSGTVTVVVQTSRGDHRNLVVSPLGVVEAS